MVPVYAICVVLGVVAVVGWVFLGLTSSSVAGKEALDPEERFGESGRMVVSGILGFGLGGMSASFAGWATGVALLGATGGAVLAVLVGRYLAVDEDAVDDDGADNETARGHT